MKDKKYRKIPLIERICKAIDVPPESLSHTPRIELHGRTVIKIQDGGKILLYTHEKIKIALPRCDDVLCVTGESLTCSFYNLGAVGIEGIINAISFCDEENEA